MYLQNHIKMMIFQVDMEADCSLFILGMIWLGFSCIVRFDWDNFLMKLRLRFWVKKRSWWCVGWWIWRLFYRVTEREQWMHATKRWEGLSCGGDEGSGAIWRKRTIVVTTRIPGPWPATQERCRKDTLLALSLKTDISKE